MANKIQLRRGLKSAMPTGSSGEPLYATDTRELFIGTGTGNVNMGGSHWYRGTAMSGTSTTSNAYSYSACPQVKLDDMYLNTSNGNIYVCTTAGSGSSAKWTYQGCIKGTTGATGATGSSGKGISSAAITYASSTSGTTAPSSWQSTIPTVSAGNYLWTRLVITYTDSTTSTSYSVARQGEMPRLDITAASGTTVSVTDGTTTLSKTSSGTVSFELPRFGDWVITAGTYNKTLSVDTVKIYKIQALPLSNATWAQIAEISESGRASDTWSIGDEKNITVGTETLTLQIYDFNHDNLTGGGKAGITFGLKNLMAEVRTMNSTRTNVGGFTGSEMYTWLQSELLSRLPEDLQGVIKFVDKKTSAGNKSITINTDSMKMFLFSEIETSGSVVYSVEGEGMPYPIFTNNASRKKYKGGTSTVIFWWGRSPRSTETGYFCGVDSDGMRTCTAAEWSRGICFGFCV